MFEKKWFEFGYAKVGEDLPVPIQNGRFGLMRNPFHFLRCRFVLTHVFFPKSDSVVREKRNNFGAPRASRFHIQNRQFVLHSNMDHQDRRRFARAAKISIDDGMHSNSITNPTSRAKSGCSRWPLAGVVFSSPVIPVHCHSERSDISIHAFAADGIIDSMDVIPACWLDFTAFRITNQV